MSRSFTYAFDANDVVTLTTMDGLGFVQGGSNSYEGYGVLAVSGLVRGRAILGLLGSGGTAGSSAGLGLYDDVVVPYGMLAPGGERYGIDGHFKVASTPGGAGTFINLPKAAATGTLFQAVNGGTLILAPATNTGAAAGLFVSNTAVGDVQHQTFFTI